ncbi:DUF1963 domain-containing protein [Streptomyces sp. NRRL F-525]|uniref:DUF1963 domain-containing protein n=1 Tax=Streptomyces sp. NRRL F-525 TaxID=1463861 RepID=UPI000A4CCE08|nr:DUF1963 domain-containing protein [Streptomyces sp. NRRL F-525]
MEQSVTGPPYDLDDLIPELAVHARRTTVLSPTSGCPGVGESSLGGPLLWPADEPWPSCAQRGHHVPPHDRNPAGTVPMVPVVQLFARDVPELPFPEGADVLQLLWCPLIHPDDQAYATLPRLHWRNEAAVLATGVLRDVPAPQQGEYDEEFVPTPCTVSPTAVIEYPNWDLPQGLQQALRPRIEELEARFGMEYTLFACALQNKVGGYPAWNQPPDWPLCARGHRMEHLLSVTAEEDLDMTMGDLGGIYIFVCRRCPELPYAHRYDC